MLLKSELIPKTQEDATERHERCRPHGWIEREEIYAVELEVISQVLDKKTRIEAAVGLTELDANIDRRFARTLRQIANRTGRWTVEIRGSIESVRK